ncbi:MAG TPA: UDP-glucose/GDP-mannose dehydrogenase family protein [Tepidiformaceae bacterium]|nr:UDP-glucose/GDP-mannose dehydrogenase family protein [Tepidiformaceae bacterium]
MDVAHPSPRQRIAVVGCGHVGVVTAACFAELGHTVTGVDISSSRVADLNSGRVEFIEPGLDALLAENLAAGRLHFTTEHTKALTGARFIFLCVNTPATPSGAADLRYVRSAVAQIAAAIPVAAERPIIVNKSTSPIGTGETIDAILTRHLADAPAHPTITANPEFLRQGSAVQDFLHPDRIVVGAEHEEDAALVAGLYDGIEAPVILTDLRTAEMIKYVSNAYLATRVSFVNEVARLCEPLGVNVETVIKGVSLDPRIGSAFFRPGIGYGGSCLPKDVAALCHTGESFGVGMRLLTSVQDVNLNQRKHAVNSIRRILGPLEGLTIAAWGATFKGESEDLRESPAIDVIDLLRNEGAFIRVFDPALSPGDSVPFADDIAADPLSAAQGADCVAVLTDWRQFRDIDPHALRSVMSGPLVYDGRNVLDRAAIEAAGLIYYGIGQAPTETRFTAGTAR